MSSKRTHFMSTVKVGEKGQVVIPKEIRDMFGIRPGDSLLMMADHTRGIAIVPPEFTDELMKHVMDGNLRVDVGSEGPESVQEPQV